MQPLFSIKSWFYYTNYHQSRNLFHLNLTKIIFCLYYLTIGEHVALIVQSDRTNNLWETIWTIIWNQNLTSFPKWESKMMITARFIWKFDIFQIIGSMETFHQLFSTKFLSIEKKSITLIKNPFTLQFFNRFHPICNPFHHLSHCGQDARHFQISKWNQTFENCNFVCSSFHDYKRRRHALWPFKRRPPQREHQI